MRSGPLCFANLAIYPEWGTPAWILWDHPPMNGISIIVPAHNNAAVILETLTSAERALAYFHERDSGRRHLPCDVVVVDDGSTDRTHDVVSGFAHGRPDYTVIRRDASSNASCARNTGVAAARGDILFFLDGDDQFLDPHIHVCCQILDDPSVDFVKTAVGLDDPVHPDWEGRIGNSLVINLAIRRQCHEFVGGFPDFHVYHRAGGELVHDFDIFRAIEDVFYNRAISRFFKGVQSPLKTVRYTRSPGNAFDRQYEKFRVGFGQFRERESAERKLQVALANLLSQYHFSRLERGAHESRQ
jgi:glycosyltransferase involved in cell wall biosynthesis